MQEIGKTGIFPEYFPSFGFSLIFRKSWTSKGFFSNENPLPSKRSRFPGDQRLGIICIPWISGAKAGKQRDELSEGTEPAGNTGKGEKPGKAFPSSQKKKGSERESKAGKVSQGPRAAPQKSAGISTGSGWLLPEYPAFIPFKNRDSCWNSGLRFACLWI